MEDEEKKKVTKYDFEKINVIGTGRFSRVYLVRRKKDGKYFAMKVNSTANILSVQEIVKERNLLSECRHPFIVGLEHAFRTKDELFLVLEYVNGGELFDRLRTHRKFKEEIVVTCGAEIIILLEYLHSKNILFRMLNPENILIDKHGHLKVCDFSFSKKLKNREDRTYTMCGIPDYLPPEIIQQDHPETRGFRIESDLWSFGIFLYDLLVGNSPFNNPNNAHIEMFQNIVSPTHVIFYPPFMSHEAKDLCQKLLRKVPEERISLNEIRHHPFFRHVNWTKFENRMNSPPFLPPMNPPTHYKKDEGIDDDEEEEEEEEIYDYDNDNEENHTNGTLFQYYSWPEVLYKLRREDEGRMDLRERILFLIYHPEKIVYTVQDDNNNNEQEFNFKEYLVKVKITGGDFSDVGGGFTTLYIPRIMAPKIFYTTKRK